MHLTSHDHATYIHSTNVGIFALALAKRFYRRSTRHDLHKLGVGFFLHDLGKCQISTDILNKADALTSAERKIIEQHPQLGHDMLSQMAQSSDEANIVIWQHHEKDDGTGYPLGLEQQQIHPYAHICRMADVYDAITSVRPYHAALSTFQALKIMKESILSDIDWHMFQEFVQLFRR